jgi:ribosomal-protein-alanine N-acetyltransferase
MVEIERDAASAAHWTVRDYEAIFAEGSPRRVALVIETERIDDDGEELRVMGFIVARCFEDEWEIENVVVEAEARRQGLGALLLCNLMEHARREHARRIYLEVREGNSAARKLYERWGFREVGRRRGYYSAPPEDALLLEIIFNC